MRTYICVILCNIEKIRIIQPWHCWLLNDCNEKENKRVAGWVQEKNSVAVQMLRKSDIFSLTPILHQRTKTSRTYQTIIYWQPCGALFLRVWLLPCFATQEKQAPEVPETKTHFQIPVQWTHSRFRRCHVLSVGFLHGHQQVSVVCHFGCSLHWLDVGQRHATHATHFVHERHSDGIPWPSDSVNTDADKLFSQIDILWSPETCHFLLAYPLYKAICSSIDLQRLCSASPFWAEAGIWNLTMIRGLRNQLWLDVTSMCIILIFSNKMQF